MLEGLGKVHELQCRPYLVLNISQRISAKLRHVGISGPDRRHVMLSEISVHS